MEPSPSGFLLYKKKFVRILVLKSVCKVEEPLHKGKANSETSKSSTWSSQVLLESAY
jgi:hypothetical protein